MMMEVENKATILGRHEQETEILDKIATDLFSEEDQITYPDTPQNLLQQKRLFCSQNFDYCGAKKLPDGQCGKMLEVNHRLVGKCTIKQYSDTIPSWVAFQELKIVRNLHCDSILKVIGAYYDNRLTLVMESYTFCLKSVKERMHLKYVIQMGKQIGDALDYLHGKDIVHCDIRPDSIVVKNDQFMLAHFAIAVKCSAGKSVESPITPKDVYYMDLNAVVNKTYGFKTDLWGLMCCMFQLEKNRHYLENNIGYPGVKTVLRILKTGLELPNGDCVTVSSLLGGSLVYDLLKLLMTGNPANSFVSSSEMKKYLKKYQQANVSKLSEVGIQCFSEEGIVSLEPMNEDLLQRANNGKFYFEQDGLTAQLHGVRNPSQKKSCLATACIEQLDITVQSGKLNTDKEVAVVNSSSQKTSGARTSQVQAPELPVMDNSQSISKVTSGKTKKLRRLDDARRGHHFLCMICGKHTTVYLNKMKKHSAQCAAKML